MRADMTEMGGRWYVNVGGMMLTVAQAKALRNRLNALLSRIEKASR